MKRMKCPRVGTKVVFNPNPASMALYSGRTPAPGSTGEVTTVPLPGGRKTCFPGPGGGLVYVDWPDVGTMGVSSYDLAKPSKGGLGNWADVARAAKTASKCPRGTHTACVPNQAPSYEGYSFGGVGAVRSREPKCSHSDQHQPGTTCSWCGRTFKGETKHGKACSHREYHEPGTTCSWCGESFPDGGTSGLGCAECAPAPMAGLEAPGQYYVVQGAARVLWASAWADVTEERGESHSGQELTEIAPPTPMEATSLATSLMGKVARANGHSISALVKMAAQADGVAPTNEFARSFGSDIAMMAMGTGVSWFDDHAEFPLTVPSVENYSLRDLV
jgi:hypothetical protein